MDFIFYNTLAGRLKTLGDQYRKNPSPEVRREWREVYAELRRRTENTPIYYKL